MNRRFGVEIEAYGVTSAALRTALHNAGLEAELAGYGQAATPYWKVSRDGSIRGVHPFELVSPILVGTQGMSDLSVALTVLHQKNAKVNQSTGLHVHIEASDFTLRSFKNLVKSFANNEDIFDALMPTSRRGSVNQYTLSLIGLTAGTDAATRTALVKAFFARIDACNSVQEIVAILGTRYRKLNLFSYAEHGTVEFRQHSGTVNRSKIINWVALCQAFVDHAHGARSVRPWGVNSMTMKARLKVLLKMIGKEDLYGFYAARLDELKANPSE